MKYIEYGSACDDCVIAIANDDYSGMDDATEATVRAGIEAAGQHLIVGDEQGFSHDRCDVCGQMPGNRHEVGYLVEGEPDEDEDEDEEDDNVCLSCGNSFIGDGDCPECSEDDQEPEPDEDSLCTSDGENFYQYGKLVLSTNPEDCDDDLVAFMNRQQFWPNCFSISDHGNAHLIDLAEAYKRANTPHCDHCGTTGESVASHGSAYRLVDPICCEVPDFDSVACKHLTTIANAAGSPVCQECGQSW